MPPLSRQRFGISRHPDLWPLFPVKEIAMSPVFPRVLILGFGAFGRLIARHLRPHLCVAICDPDPVARADAGALGLSLADVAQAGDFDLVVLAVPVPALGDCLCALAPHLRPGQMVMDVCSVKQGPADLMRRILPGDVGILGAHPMFGPQSMPGDLAGGRVVLCPVRDGVGALRWRRIAAFLRRVAGLRVIVTTPDEHDRHAALTQGLTHLLARAMADFRPHPLIRTRSFDLLAEALGMVGADAPELFEAVTQGNPHLDPLRERFARLLLAPGRDVQTGA